MGVLDGVGMNFEDDFPVAYTGFVLFPGLETVSTAGVGCS
jgi:hypothetical protein